MSIPGSFPEVSGSNIYYSDMVALVQGGVIVLGRSQRSLDLLTSLTSSLFLPLLLLLLSGKVLSFSVTPTLTRYMGTAVKVRQQCVQLQHYKQANQQLIHQRDELRERLSRSREVVKKYRDEAADLRYQLGEQMEFLRQVAQLVECPEGTETAQVLACLNQRLADKGRQQR